MSKREAEVQGTKETGLSGGEPDAEGITFQRATAAQIAKRNTMMQSVPNTPVPIVQAPPQHFPSQAQPAPAVVNTTTAQGFVPTQAQWAMPASASSMASPSGGAMDEDEDEDMDYIEQGEAEPKPQPSSVLPNNPVRFNGFVLNEQSRIINPPSFQMPQNSFFNFQNPQDQAMSGDAGQAAQQQQMRASQPASNPSILSQTQLQPQGNFSAMNFGNASTQSLPQSNMHPSNSPSIFSTADSSGAQQHFQADVQNSNTPFTFTSSDSIPNQQAQAGQQSNSQSFFFPASSSGDQQYLQAHAQNSSTPFTFGNSGVGLNQQVQADQQSNSQPFFFPSGSGGDQQPLQANDQYSNTPFAFTTSDSIPNQQAQAGQQSNSQSFFFPTSSSGDQQPMQGNDQNSNTPFTFTTSDSIPNQQAQAGQQSNSQSFFFPASSSGDQQYSQAYAQNSSTPFTFGSTGTGPEQKAQASQQDQASLHSSTHSNLFPTGSDGAQQSLQAHAQTLNTPFTFASSSSTSNQQDQASQQDQSTQQHQTNLQSDTQSVLFAPSSTNKQQRSDADAQSLNTPFTFSSSSSFPNQQTQTDQQSRSQSAFFPTSPSSSQQPSQVDSQKLNTPFKFSTSKSTTSDNVSTQQAQAKAQKLNTPFVFSTTTSSSNPDQQTLATTERSSTSFVFPTKTSGSIPDQQASASTERSSAPFSFSTSKAGGTSDQRASKTDSQKSNGISVFPSMNSSSTSLQQPSKAIVQTSNDHSSNVTLTAEQAENMMPPYIPSNFTETQVEQFIIGYRLRSLDAGLKKHIMETDTFSGADDEVLRFHKDLKQRILAAKASPLLLPGVKRKLSDDDRANASGPDPKRANTNGFAQSMNTSGKPRLFPASSSKKANIFTQSGLQSATAVPKSNHSTESSQTSKLFANITNEDHSNTPKSTFKVPTTNDGHNSTPKSTFKVPSFGPVSGSNFMSQFGKKAEEEEKKEKAKRKAEDFDSDEDDEAEWEKKYEEEQRLKRQKISEQVPEAIKKATFVFDPTKSTSTSATPTFKTTGSDHISYPDLGTPSGNKGGSSNESALSNTNTSSLKNSVQFENPFANLAQAAQSRKEEGEAVKDGDDKAKDGSKGKVRSLFDRIDRDENGQSKRETSPPRSNNVFNPFATGQPKPLFNFSGTDTAPSVKVTAASPSSSSVDPSPSKPSSYIGLFGASKSTATEPVSKSAANPVSSPGFQFGTPTKPASVDSLTVPPEVTSNFSSRAASPSSLGESVNESTIDVNIDAPGNQDEEIIFEVRARISEFDSRWTTKGVGQLYVLKNKETEKTRMLLRLPNGKVVFNAGLMGDLDYVHAKGAKKVTFPAPDGAGGLRPHSATVKKDDDAAALAAVLQANR